MTHGKPSTYKRGCHCDPCTEAQRLHIARQRAERALRSPKPLRSQQQKCRRGHPLTPENTTVLANGWRRCRICNRKREMWRARGGSLSGAIAWAKAVCGPNAPALSDDDWEHVLRVQVFGQERIVRSIVLLPGETLNKLCERRGGAGVDSLGRPVDPSEAWL